MAKKKKKRSFPPINLHFASFLSKNLQKPQKSFIFLNPIPAENKKTQPKFTAKNKKPPFRPQKPTKPHFSPLNFPSKTVIFPNFPQKRQKS